MSIVVCHAGSASDPAWADGPRRACLAGLDVMTHHGGALEAAVAATRVLEDDERFNAGTGSNLRFDGETIQMDAACMSGDGLFGAVGAIERVRHPIDAALHVLHTPHILVVGEGATAFARKRGLEDFDPTTSGASERFRRLRSTGGEIGEWSREQLEQAWNFESSLREVLGGDTVGSVAWDGTQFAAALSSGGTTTVLRGRVGDVPLPGCGLFAGDRGAVALTGDGEHIALSLLAYRAYLELERGRSAEQTVRWALSQLSQDVDIGIIVVNRDGFFGGARHDMAWHGQRTEVAA